MFFIFAMITAVQSIKDARCLDHLDAVNHKINADVRKAQKMHTSWTLEPKGNGSMRWNNGQDWSDESKAKQIDMCAANDATACKIRMFLIQQVENTKNILYMDTFALACRPKACSTSSWPSTVSFIASRAGPNAFFWNPKEDPITNACADNPSLCTFKFNVCGAVARFPYKSSQITSFDTELKNATKTEAPEAIIAKENDPSTQSISSSAIIVASVSTVAMIGLVIYQLRRSRTQEVPFHD